MTKPRFIGITGVANSGKDTVARQLYGYGYHRYGFADPLKAALDALGIHEPQTREEKEAPIPGFGFSYRHAAQTLGTEWARQHLGADFWVKLAAKKTALMPLVAFSDVRFEEEAVWVRSVGGRIIHIVGRSSSISGQGQTHASERGVIFNPATDAVIENDTSLNALHEKVSKLIDLWS